MTRVAGTLREVVRDVPKPCEQDEMARREIAVAETREQPLLLCAPAAAGHELADDRPELAPPHERASRHQEVDEVEHRGIARGSSFPVHDAGGLLPVRRDEDVAEPVVAVPPPGRQPAARESAP